MSSKRLSSSLFSVLGVAVPVLVAGFGNACSSDFEGCAASRSCGAAAGEAGEGGSGATAGKGGAGGKGAGGSAGRAVEMGGEGGEEAGGKGGTSGSNSGGTGGMAGGDAGQGGGDDEGGAPGTGGSGGSSGSAGAGGTAGSSALDMTPPTLTLKRLTRLVPPSAARDEADLEGATGVAADTTLVLTFSEPMDRVTTQAAFQSADISGVTFAWSGDDTVLTITPNAALAYATGDSTVAALSYTISITDTAEDQAGNRMASSWSGTFSTMRQVSQTLTASGAEAVRHIRTSSNTSCGSDPWVGDNTFNEASCIAIQFDLALIPEGIVSWLRSTASGEFLNREGAAFTHLGDVHFYEFDAVPLTTAGWATMPIVDRGVFAYNDRQYPSIDLLGSMPEAYATQGTNGTLLQYRVSFPIQTNSDETLQLVRFACTYDLELEYLIP